MKKNNISNARYAVQPDGSTGVLEQSLQSRVNRLACGGSIRHAVLAVLTGDGRFSWKGSAGEAFPDGTPMRPDLPIWIASITKLYIASCVLIFQERGAIHLDAPVSDYLPDTLVGGLHRFKGTDYSAKLTIRHLLGHMSGLADYFDTRPKGGKSFVDRVIEKDFAFTIADVTTVVRDSLDPLFPPQDPLDRKARVSYSDTNFQLLIAVLEAVSGKPFAEVLDELICKPLGLTNTWHPASLPEGIVPAGTWMGTQLLDVPLAARSFGDLYATVDDLLLFMRALVTGQVFSKPETVQQMSAAWHTFGFSLNPVRLSPGWPIQYGLGMMRFSIPKVFTSFRQVPAVIGHTGATGSWLFYCPELDVYITGTVDQATGAAVPFRIVPELLGLLAENLPPVQKGSVHV